MINKLKALKEKKSKYQELNKQVEELKQELAVLEAEMYDEMFSENIDNINIDGHCLYRREDNVAYIVKEQEDAVYKWLKDNNYHIVKETVNYKTLTALIKELMEQNTIIPEGVNLKTYKKIGMRRS